MEEQIGFDDNFYPKSESPESESNVKNCTDTNTPAGLGNLELSDVFQAEDMIQLLLCIGVAIVMVIPALSVYFRNTDEPPRKSYKASCLVKLIVGFLTSSALVSDIYLNWGNGNGNNCPGSFDGSVFPFFAALFTEAVEFMFDFGRLIVYFRDPGTIDYYQNVRWNSAFWASGMVTLCAVPLMFIMWILVLVSNIISFFSLEIKIIPLYFFLFISFLGGYYLLRTCCTFRKGNDGENKGTGYFWNRFKLVAVDLPSLLASLSKPSLALFWIAELFNDVFPVVAPYGFDGILANYFSEKEEDTPSTCSTSVPEIGNDNGNGNGNTEQDKLIDLGKQSVVALISLKSHDTKTSSGDADNATGSTATNKTPRNKIHGIDRRMPKILGDQLTENEWLIFCDEIDLTLSPVVSQSDSKCEVTMKVLKIMFKVFFMSWAYLSTILYWNFLFSNFVLVVIFSTLGLWALYKSCFGRNVGKVNDLLERLDDVCQNQNQVNLNVIFSVRKDEDGIFMKSMKWICWRGFSCIRPISSIRYIECNVIVKTDGDDREDVENQQEQQQPPDQGNTKLSAGGEERKDAEDQQEQQQPPDQGNATATATAAKKEEESIAREDEQEEKPLEQENAKVITDGEEQQPLEQSNVKVSTSEDKLKDVENQKEHQPPQQGSIKVHNDGDNRQEPPPQQGKAKASMNGGEDQEDVENQQEHQLPQQGSVKVSTGGEVFKKVDGDRKKQIQNPQGNVQVSTGGVDREDVKKPVCKEAQGVASQSHNGLSTIEETDLVQNVHI